MTTVGDLLARDLKQKIEEIIKVDQNDEQSVYSEITEYVATDRIKGQYREILQAMADAPAEPTEGVGVWISGFFGSGKSSFAKNLGYMLANRTVLGTKANDLFKAQLDDRRLGELIDYLNTRIPTEVIMFDVSVDKAVRQTTQKLAEIMYTVLLRELGYAEDYDIAELEIELEQEGKLDEFASQCYKRYGIEWRTVRKGAQKISRASAILHALAPATYSTPDSWSQSLRDKSADITVGKFVERAFDLAARRRPGRGLVFIVDEVGQYVARSAEKIEDLRAIVEQFGKESKNRLKAMKAVAPVWVIVTSQEKLDEVVAAIDSKRIELAKLQDRFKYRVDLAPADIREVATRRVLAKKEDGVSFLKRVFIDAQGQLNVACRLERTSRKSEVNEGNFVQFYPYLPHFVELSIDIMSGIRLQPGAPRHLGGSNRTIIKQAYEMLVSERTNLAALPAGTLVTLDKIFELVEGNLSTEKQKDISDITQRFKGDPDDAGMAARVAKTICLLEFVRDLPRTEANIAACLVDEVGKPGPLAGVQSALKKLEAAQFVRNLEEGWKLQTAQEKNWDTELRTYAPKPKDRNEIVRETLRDIFADPKLKTYRFNNLRNFRVGIGVDGFGVGDEGQVRLSLVTADDSAAFAGKLEEVRQESRQEAHKNDVYWVFSFTGEIDDLAASLFASREMVKKYDQLRAQNRITNEEAASLSDEKMRAMRLQGLLRDAMIGALEKGQGLFCGVSKDATALGKDLSEIVKRLFDFAVPDLYPKLAMAARPLKGNEPEEILKAANLSGLSQVFYDAPQGLNMVIKEDGKLVCNPNADVAKEVLDYLNREHSYGNKDTRLGKALETHFGGIGYGWDLDVLRLILAMLFRGGSIEIFSAGKRYDSYQEPQSRVPFTNTPAFRSTLFTPAKPLDLKTLTQAVVSYEELSGQTVDVEKNAIAAAFKKVAEKEIHLLLPVEVQVNAHKLPVAAILAEYRATLEGVQNDAADDCVQILAGEGKSLKEVRDRVRRIRDVTSEQNMAVLRRAHLALEEMWPALLSRSQHLDLASPAEELQTLLASETFFESMPAIKTLALQIATAYRPFYADLHDRRAKTFLAAVDDIKGLPDWESVQEGMREPVLRPLVSRVCPTLSLPDSAANCKTCGATLGQMESDQMALSALKAQVAARVQELTTPEQKVERVRLVDFFADVLDSEKAINEGIGRLQEQLLKLYAEGARIFLE